MLPNGRVRVTARRYVVAGLVAALTVGSVPTAGYAELADWLLAPVNASATEADCEGASKGEGAASKLLDATGDASEVDGADVRPAGDAFGDTKPAMTGDAPDAAEATDTAGSSGSGDASDVEVGDGVAASGPVAADAAGQGAETDFDVSDSSVGGDPVGQMNFADATESEGVYKVGDKAGLNVAIEKIEVSDRREAAIVLTGNIDLGSDEQFAGITGKHVMVTSEGDATYTLELASELVGDLTLGNVNPDLAGDPYNGYDALYVNGHRFETTEAFTSTIHTVYGGGSKGNDVSGDTNLVLAGGRFEYLYGGGLDSAVSGSTHITLPKGSVAWVGNLYGGGHATEGAETSSGTVKGDVNVLLQGGSTGGLVGGGRNDRTDGSTDRTPAKVEGAVNLTAGYEGAEKESVKLTTSWYAVGGSWRSTVGSINIQLFDGAYAYKQFCGAGYSDDVLGTVSIHVKGSASLYQLFGSGTDDNDPPIFVDGHRTRVLNQQKKPNAISLVIEDSPGCITSNVDVLGTGDEGDQGKDLIEGNVSIEVKNSTLKYLFVGGAKKNGARDFADLNGNATISLHDGAKVREIYGHEDNFADANRTYKTEVVCDSGTAATGYLAYVDTLRVENGAKLIADGREVQEGFETVPFPSTKAKGLRDLVVTDSSVLETAKLAGASAIVWEDVVIKNGGMWKAGDAVVIGDESAEAGGSLSVTSGGLLESSAADLSVYGPTKLDGGALTANGKAYLYGDVALSNEATLTSNNWLCVYEKVDSQDSSLYFNDWTVIGQHHKEDEGSFACFISKGDTVVAKKPKDQTKVHSFYGSASLDGSDWALLWPTEVSGDWSAKNASALRLPVVAGVGNYTGAATPRIPLRIGGTASGACTVLTVNHDDRTQLAMPKVGDNYIVGLAPEGTSADNPVQATFVLGNKDATSLGYYLKRVLDPANTSGNYMWQVAIDPRSVLTYDKNAEAARGETPASEGEIGDAVTVAENGFTRHGYTFTGWNTEPNGTGEEYAEGQTLTLPAGGEILYAQWEANDPWYPRAVDLTAYEGGVGSGGAAGTGDALPKPEWVSAREDVPVYVDGEFWDTDEKGVPFEWAYFDASGNEMAESSPRGTYTLRAWEREDLKGREVVVGDQPLAFPEGNIVSEISVRDVTDDASAESLSSEVLKPVYNDESSLARVAAPRFASARTALGASALAGESAWDGSFDGETGTRDEWCGEDENVHAHVARGTKFFKNGRGDLPVNEGARIALLWDAPLPDVLGREDIAEQLKGMAEDAVPGTFDEGAEVGHETMYADLVDMNDGNLWVGTDGEPVTVFWPYPEGVDASDEVAAVYYDGLTRDYTIGMDANALEAAVDASAAHELALTKTEKGVLVDVPSGKFGPLDLMWQVDGGSGGEEREPSKPGKPVEPGRAGDEGGELPATGDPTLMAVAGTVAAGAALLGAATVAHRRRR